ncbi:MAG: NAD(P)-dependent oxidoreductase, partial [Polyangiales bacterium]
MIRLLYCGSGWLDVVPRIERALDVPAEVRVRDRSRPVVDQLADIDVVLPSNMLLGPSELAAGPKIRLIQQPAVGHEGIDLAAARARDIPVCNAPGMNSDAVAQAALLLILALARRFPRAQKAFVRAEIGGPAGIELTGRTIAIVGFGRTGTRLAQAVEALGMRVLPVRREGRAALLDALAVADVVSLHAPLNASTRGMIDDEALAAMKEGALLVNASRGGLIDRPALERALPRLGGVGLDVFWEEPWNPADPLFSR